MQLWQQTRDLHHACEAHPVGAAMASGTPPRHWYAAWLDTLHQIHAAIDPHLPEAAHRAARVRADMDAMGFEIPHTEAAARYVETLTDERAIAGAGYVLTGAHLMGGEIMRRRLDGFPTQHLEWDDRKAALAVLQGFRDRDDLVSAARACFGALLASMDEIHARETP